MTKEKRNQQQLNTGSFRMNGIIHMSGLLYKFNDATNNRLKF